jgi:hypothetical protein
MKHRYTVNVDMGENTGARFIFYQQFELMNFIKTCLETDIERDLQIEMRLEKDA